MEQDDARSKTFIRRTFVIMILNNSIAFYVLLGWLLLGNKNHKETYKRQNDWNIKSCHKTWISFFKL